MALRSEKLKRFEAELADLEHWATLGLVPKSDLEKHGKEIESIKKKIADETRRLRAAKESGETEEYVTPRKQAPRVQYSESPTMPDMVAAEAPTAMTEVTSNNETETPTTTGESETVEETTTEEEDPFSDKNRWKRGMLHSEDEEW